MAEFEANQFRPDMDEILGEELNALVQTLSADPTALFPALQNMLHAKIIKYEEKVKEKVQQKVEEKKEKILEQLPTKEELIEKFNSFACSPPAQKAMTNLYNLIKGRLGEADTIAQPIMDELDQLILKGDDIKALIRRIGENLLKISEIVAIVAAIIIIIKALLIALKAAAMTPIAGALIIPVIIEIEKVVDFISEKIVDPMYSIVIDAIPETLAIMGNIVVGVALILASIIAAITALLLMIEALLRALEALYLKYLNTCNLSPTGTDNDGNIPDNINDYLYQSDEDISNYYDETLAALKAQGADEVIEKIYNANFQQVGYKRYKI